MSLHKQYADEMRWHDLGYALYHPQSSSALAIGDVGIFNALGQWNRIGNITNAKSLERYGLQPVNLKLDRMPTEDTGEWGPLLAEHVSGLTLEAGGEAS